MKRIILSSIFALLLLGLQAQELAPCGTLEAPPRWLEEYQQNPMPFNRSNNDTIYVPLTVHLVGNSDGGGYISIQRMWGAFCTLNQDFRESAIQFYVEGPIRYINNSVYYEHNFTQGSQMMNQNNVPNTLNCYIVNSPAGNCGYSIYGLGIALAINCTKANDHTWAHELGHQLSLPHPFRGWEGFEHDYSQNAPNFVGNRPVERVDGSNCAAAGDGFCDTSPDYLNFRWNCTANAQSNVVQRDPDGMEFRSDASLIMGYSLSQCSNRFTPEQMAAMRANLLTERQFLLYNQTPPTPLGDIQLNPITPLDGEMIGNQAFITLEWEPIAGAQEYMVEITFLPAFGFVYTRFTTPTNSLVFPASDLIANRVCYWRIRPFNGYDGCTAYSNIRTFQLGNIVSSREVALQVEDVQILPNPAASGGEATLAFIALEATAVQLSLLDISGRVRWQQRQFAPSGENRLPLSLEGLPAGIYLLRLEANGGVVSRRLVVK